MTISNDIEYSRALGRLLELDSREDLSFEEEDESVALTDFVEDYEERQYPLPSVAPHESLRALMEDRGLAHKDLWPVLGNKGSATEILNGRRSISKEQAKRLAAFFRVQVELFL
ncbi:MAG: type II toxin-antitoxin system HigA family antitoxin [Bryobacteraceae bacterium]